MRIDNYTNYDTRWLKKIFSKAKNQVEKIEGKLKDKLWDRYIRLEVKVIYRKGQRYGSWVGGNASYNSGRMTIKMPKERPEIIEGLPFELAKTYIHEFYHNLGWHHDRMGRFGWGKTQTRIENRFNVDWVKDYPVKMKEAKPKPQRDLQMGRYEKVLRYVKIYQGKVKRVQNLLKKWKQKQRRYEKILIAAGKVKPK